MTADKKNKKFNVLHVIPRLPVGGVENMLLKVIEGYDKERFNVIVCCIKEKGEIADELIRLGYRVEVLNKMQKKGFDWGAVSGLRKLMKRHEIHIVRTHMYHANMYGRIASILAGVPVKITSSHDLYISPDKPKFHRRLINCILGMFSDAVVAVSQSVASDILKYDKVSRGKVKIIYNGIAIDKFTDTLSRREAREVFHLPADGTIIGSVGRLTDQKGHRYLVEAAAGLGNVSIALAGDGPERERLQELARQCRVNCIMPGRLEPEKVRTFLGALDIFCFPSLWEGFGTALVEAMASGLPVIASDIPPHREVLGDAGEFVAPGNSKDLSEALRRFTDAPFLMERFGEKAKSRAVLFSIEATVRAYEELFADILKRKGML